MNNNGLGKRHLSSEVDYNQSMKYAKRSFVKKIITLGLILVLTLTISTLLLKPLISTEYLIYSQIVQVGIIGYVVIEIVGNTAFKLAMAAQQSQHTAKSIKGLMRVVGSVVIFAIAASYLRQNAVLAASIATVVNW